MGIFLLHFSPTGSSKRVGKLLAKVWKEPVKRIDLTKQNFEYAHTFNQEDVCYFAVPAFGGRVPALALAHLTEIYGKQTPAVLIATYGNRAFDDLFLELQDFLSPKGFVVNAAVASVTEHSIVDEFGAGRPNEADIAELNDFAQKIQTKIQTQPSEISTLGNKPYRSYQTADYRPLTSDACTDCKLCAEKCPTCAIPYENPRETIFEKCILCMRCIHICPEKARYVDPTAIASLKNHLQEVAMGHKANQLFLK